MITIYFPKVKELVNTQVHYNLLSLLAAVLKHIAPVVYYKTKEVSVSKPPFSLDRNVKIYFILQVIFSIHRAHTSI